MGLTSAEKQKRYREKLKSKGNYDDYKKKHQETSRKSKCGQHVKLLALPSSLRKQKIDALRTANRKRVAQFRRLERQRKAEAQRKPSPFNSAMAFAKATARAKRILQQALPSSPRKRQKVSRKLYTDIFAELPQSSSKAKKITANSLSAETTEKVVKFYERDDVSRQAPGLKDCKTVRGDDGTKKKVQIRHLMSSLKETHALFCEEYQTATIGKSKFAELRPKYVCLSKDLPHNVCLCRYHENFIFAIDALHKACPAFPSYDHSLPETLLCTTPKRQCWLNECSDCQNAAGFRRRYMLIFDDVADNNLTWYNWQNGEDNRLVKAVEEGTIDDLLDYISDHIPQFLEHCFTKREQATSYHAEREESLDQAYDPEKALVQVDFSENYTCVWQDEIQAAHWNQRQVTIFTVATYHSGKVHSSVLVSDNLQHSKETLVAYVDTILDDLPPTVQTVSLWSDGPRSQFKNRFVAASISALEKKHSIKIRWNYFATSHGKGPVDGIGGSTKRFVWNAVRTRKQIVKDATTFVTAAAQMTKVHVREMTNADIASRNGSLNLDEVFASAELIKNIARMHTIEVKNGQVMCLLLTSDTTTEPTSEEPEAEPDIEEGAIQEGITSNGEIEVGEWYVVEYDKKLYPGEVKEIGELGDYRVSVMHGTKDNWKWPNRRDDKTFYRRSQMIRKLGTPLIANSRGQFKFASKF